MKTSRLLNIVIFIDSKSEGFIKVRSLYFSKGLFGVSYDFFLAVERYYFGFGGDCHASSERMFDIIAFMDR